jgi:hypothetical protein
MTAIYDIETEQAILGNIVSSAGIDNNFRLSQALSSGLEAKDFYDSKNRAIYRSMLDIAKLDQPVDLITTKRKLEDSGQLDEIGMTYLARLGEGVPTNFDVAKHAEQLVQLARHRILLSAASNLQAAENAGNGGTPAAIADLRKALSEFDKPASKEFKPPDHWQLLDVADVDDWKCDNLHWIIEHIAARGNLIFVAADSQCGKTLFALYVILQLLTSGYLFGQFKINAPKKVLYLLLEDPTRRAKARILDMRQDIRIDRERFNVYVAPGLTITDEIHFGWLRKTILDGGYDFIVLDTYQKSTPGISSFDDVKQGPILHRLANLTRELNVTLWIHDHYRKDGGGAKKRKELDPSSLKGTGGKPQNADCFILMERTGDKIKIGVSSKDSDRHPRFLLHVSPEGSNEEKFSWAGNLEDAAGDMRILGEINKQHVLDALPKDGSWVTRSLIEGATGLKGTSVKKHLETLINDKIIESNGKSGKAIRYRIGRGEMPLRPIVVNEAVSID